MHPDSVLYPLPHSSGYSQSLRDLRSNYSEHITLDHLAALSHLNKYYLSHEFTKYYNLSRKRIDVCKNQETGT